MLILFGYALNFDVKHLSLAVLDRDNTPRSRQLITEFTNTEYFDLNCVTDRSDDLEELIAHGNVSVALEIPSGFANDIVSGGDPEVQILIDGTNPTTASTAAAYSQMIVLAYSESMLRENALRIGIKDFTRLIDYRPRIWFNPELRSARFLVPGLIGFILMVTAVVSTSLSVVREKEHGTLDQLTVSPVRPFELLFGKTIPYIAISLAATAVILFAGYIFFGVTVKGSFALLALVTIVYLIGCLGLGLLISSISSTQQVAFMVAVMVTILPTFLLSGFVFPIRNMPPLIQAVTVLVPARYFLVALRAIVLKGVGLQAFWEQMAYLTIFSTVTLTVASVRLRKQLIGAYSTERENNK